MYFPAPCPSFFCAVLVALAVRLRLVLPCPMLSCELLARGVLSSKRRRFAGSSSRDKAAVPRVNIVERAVETRDGVAVIACCGVTGICGDSEVLAIVEAIREVRRWTSALRLSRAREVDLVCAVVDFWRRSMVAIGPYSASWTMVRTRSSVIRFLRNLFILSAICFMPLCSSSSVTTSSGVVVWFSRAAMRRDMS